MASPPVILCAAAIVMAYCHSVPWDILSYRIMSSSCLYIQILNIQYACMSWSWYLCAMLRVPVSYACIVCYEYTHMPRCLYRCIVYSVHCVCLYAIHRQRLIMSGESSVLLRCSCPSNIFIFFLSCKRKMWPPSYAPVSCAKILGGNDDHRKETTKYVSIVYCERWSLGDKSLTQNLILSILWRI